jgi:hypothetical protein
MSLRTPAAFGKIDIIVSIFIEEVLTDTGTTKKENIKKPKVVLT